MRFFSPSLSPLQWEKKTNVCFSCLCGCVLVLALEAVDDDTRAKATRPLLLPSCFHVSVNDDNCLSAVKVALLLCW
jgi:hypothetical protein